MTDPPSEAWWVRDRPEADDGAIAPTPASVAVTTRLPDPPPSLRLTPAPTTGRDSGQSRFRGGLRPAALVGVPLVLLTAIGWGLHAVRTTGSAGPGRAPAVAAEPVDPGTVQASASSTQDPDGAVSYGPANTLDGDPATAWNSDGDSPARWLSYRFATPVDLRSVSILNGYQKVRRRPGRSALDLYPVNERLRRIRVVTDAGNWLWELADRRERQTFTAPSGRTRTVRLEVLSSYPSTDYPDLAVSEVSFTAAGAAR